MTKATSSIGRLLATALRGAWREPPPPVAMSAGELGEIAPLLLETGGGALGWWRFQHSTLASSPAGQRLKMAYRLHSLDAEVHEREIARVVGHLRSEGLDNGAQRMSRLLRTHGAPLWKHYAGPDLLRQWPVHRF